MEAKNLIEKYTADGKKVVVVESLNSTQYIVQEVFVTEDGKEIPAGEKFVAQQLFDVPVKSWATKEQERQKKELEYLDSQYKKEEKEGREKLTRLKNQIYREQQTLEGHLKWLKAVAKEPHYEEIKQIIRDLYTFLSEKIWFCRMYDGPVIIEYSHDNAETILDTFWDGKFDGMRLVSLYGRADGNLRWKIHTFCDGSGGGNDDYVFFASYEEAVAWAQEKFDSMNVEYISKKCIDRVRGYGCEVSDERINQIYQSLIEREQKKLAEHKATVEKDEERINGLIAERNSLCQR